MSSLLTQEGKVLVWLYQNYPEGGTVQSSELGNAIPCNYPRISHALSVLSSEGCVAYKETSENHLYEKYNFMFTDKGKKYAKQLIALHY